MAEIGVLVHNGGKCPPKGRPKNAETKVTKKAKVANGPEEAKALGYDRRIPPQKAPFDSHEQPVYSNGRNYITPDVDSHKGGVWKLFNHKGKRVGTFDENLKKIGE